MEVGVHKSLELKARMAVSAAVVFAFVFAVYVLGVCQCERKRSKAALSEEELCVRDAVLLYALYQLALDFIMPYDLRKKHYLLITRCTKLLPFLSVVLTK